MGGTRWLAWWGWRKMPADDSLFMLFSDYSVDVWTRHLFGLDAPVSSKGVDAE